MTRIISKDRMIDVSRTAADALKALYDHPSKEKKREYQLQHFSLSELVSDLWWNKKKMDNRKGRGAAE